MKKVTVTIDDKKTEVDEGINLIEAAARVGIKIPHYCYHPGLRADGNCRMCLVQVEKIPKPAIACRTGATEGMVVKTQTPEIKKIRASVMEFLLINHPLDCPTCDQAGECRLQDYYMDYDRIPSRYQEEKVHKDKMVDLGAGVILDEERCIVCTRCVRVTQEVAKNEELYVQERGNHSMVATFPGKKMTSPYSGNTIDVCPVGALTSKDFRFKKRVWFLTETDSICPGCSRGCSISVHHADNQVYRLKPRLNPDVNKYWMCDFGRYDYKFINENRRLRPGFRQKTAFVESSVEEALSQFKKNSVEFEPVEIAFVASALESNQEIDVFCAWARDEFGAKDIYYSKHDPKNPTHDDILITADKNPNSAHAKKLGLKTLDQIPSHIKAVIIQRDVSEKDLKLIYERNLNVLALFSTNLTAVDEIAEVILPIPTYAEQDGSFTNVDGKVQNFKRALTPRGESKLLREYVKMLIS